MHQTSIRIPEEIYKWLRIQAVKEDRRSTNELIAEIIIKYFEEKNNPFYAG